MATCAFLCSPKSLKMFQPIIENMPSDYIDICFILSPEEEARGVTLDDFSFCSEDIGSLKKKGYTVQIISPRDVEDYPQVIADVLHYKQSYQPILAPILHKKQRTLSLFHNVDSFAIHEGEHYCIYAHQKHALRPMPNRACRSLQPDVFKQLQELPQEVKTEFSYTGPFHLGEWETKRLLPKAELRAELEEYLQTKLPVDRPIVAFLQDEIGHDGQTVQGLAKLAEYATIIAKPLTPLNLPSSILQWPSKSFAPNLLRFASDFMLAGFHSGTFASSLMLGLHVIPYHTRIVYKNGRAAGHLGNYKSFLHLEKTGNPHICPYCIEQMGFTMDLEDTKGIVDLMNNNTFWDDYHARLPQMQKSIFGDYIIEGAAQKTAMLAMRALVKGSFGTDTEAIQIRPEFIES